MLRDFNFLNKIKSKFRFLFTKSVSRIIPNYVNFYNNYGLTTPNDFNSMVNAYRSWVFVCVQRNSVNVASVPLKLYLAKKRNSKKLLVETKEVKKETKDFLLNSPTLSTLDCVRKAIDLEEVIDHPLLKLLKNVNAFFNGFDLMEGTETFLELVGNAYWYVVKNNFGLPVEIWLVPAHKMTIVPDKNKFIKGYLYRDGFDMIPFEENEIIHFKFFSPTNMFYGASPLSAVIDAYNTNENIAKYANAIFKNMGTPEGILTTEQDLGEDEFERLKAEWTKVYGGTGNAGKGHTYGTPILTTLGWKKIEDLKIGDYLFSQDGSPTILKDKFYRGDQQCYRFTFDDGTFIDCDEEHLWSIKTKLNRRKIISKTKEANKNYGKYSIFSTKQIFEHYNSKNKKVESRYFIPATLPIQFSKKEVPIDPYTLGCLLGDGCISETRGKHVYIQRSVQFTTSDPEIVNNMNVDYNYYGKYQYRIFGITEELCELGLMGKLSHTKFIPEIYLYNDVETRLAILQGLLDTDGSIETKNRKIIFTTTSLFLKDDIMFLVRSLGGRASYASSGQRPNAIFNGKEYKRKERYKIYIRLNNFNPFRLIRKANLIRPFIYTFDKIIVSVEKIDIKPTICLSVEHESGLYVAKDFIVTHNTALLSNGVNYKAVSYTPKELGFLIGRNATIQEIAAAYGVPVSKLTSKDVNLANAYVGERQYQKDTILPRLRRIEQKANERLVPIYDENLFCAYDNPIPEDKELILREREVNLRTGFMPINELRAERGLKPVEWGDIPIVPSGNAPLGSSPYYSSGQIDNLAQQISNSIKIKTRRLKKV